MSRSCQSATFSRPGLRVAAQHAGQARDPLGDDRVALVRHRARALLALAERLLDLAHLGALEVPDLGRQPLERGAGERDRASAAAAWRSRGTTCVETGSRASPSRVQHGLARPSGSSAEYVPTAPESLPTASSSNARSSRPRLRSASNAKPASFSPNVVGSACTPCVRPMQSVSRYSRARATSTPTSSPRAANDHLARVAQLQRQRRCRARPRR